MKNIKLIDHVDPVHDSGENFKTEILVPEIFKACQNNEKILLDLDGTFGYPILFLDKVFKGLSAMGDVFFILQFKSDDEPGLVDVIKDLMVQEP